MAAILGEKGSTLCTAVLPCSSAKLCLSGPADCEELDLLGGWVGGGCSSVGVPLMCVPFHAEHFAEKDEILLDVTSRLWFTYRKNFPAIGMYSGGA